MTHHLVGMAEIAEMLGVTRQRVAQLIESYEDFPKPEVELSGGRVWSRTAIETWIATHPERGPGRSDPEERRPRFFGRASGGLFSRFTDRARNSIVKAQEEARLLEHNYIGTEHLLLGLIAIREGLAFQVLSGLGITLEASRGQVERMIGRGSGAIKGHIPFTPRAKKCLELALREAKHLNHNYIGTEHVLLGIIREGEGVAVQMLAESGASDDTLRAAIRAAMAGTGATKAAPAMTTAWPARSGVAYACSFCGKRREDVTTLVAGPGSVAICAECVALAAEVVAVSTPASDDPGSTRLSEVVMDEIATKGPEADLAARVAEVEERLRKLEEPPEA